MYKPISCDFYDAIINTVTLNQEVLVEYEVDNNLEISKGYIVNVFTRDKEEFCRINNLEIRLDKIKSIVITKPKT